MSRILKYWRYSCCPMNTSVFLGSPKARDPITVVQFTVSQSVRMSIIVGELLSDSAEPGK